MTGGRAVGQMALHITGAYFLLQKRSTKVSTEPPWAAPFITLIKSALPVLNSETLDQGPPVFSVPCGFLRSSLTPSPIQSPQPHSPSPPPLSIARAYDNLGKLDMNTWSHSESVDGVWFCVSVVGGLRRESPKQPSLPELLALSLSKSLAQAASRAHMIYDQGQDWNGFLCSSLWIKWFFSGGGIVVRRVAVV